MTTQSAGDIVRVTATISPSGSPRATLGKTLYLDEGTALDPVGSGKAREYASLSEVARDFATTDAAYLAAQRYFSQVPYPNRLIVGRWTVADQNALVRGGAHSDLSTLQAISSGSFTVGGESFSGLDFSGDNSLSDVAAGLQTELRTGTGAAFASATASYETANDRFVVEFSDAEDNGSLFTGSSAGALGLDADSGATYHPGGVQETVTAGLDAVQEVNDTFYWATIPAAYNGTQTMLDVSAWVAAQNAMFVAESNEAGALVTNETTSFAARLAAVQSERTVLVWSAEADYKALSIAARMSSVDFEQPGSLITLAYKTLPGCAPDILELYAAQRVGAQEP